VAVIAPDPIELTRDQIERALPTHRHEWLAAAAGAVSRSLREPAFADYGPTDASLGVDGVRNGVEQWRRIGVVLKRSHADHAAVPDLSLKCPIV
jgi:hypothetical protein